MMGHLRLRIMASLSGKVELLWRLGYVKYSMESQITKQTRFFFKTAQSPDKQITVGIPYNRIFEHFRLI